MAGIHRACRGATAPSSREIDLLARAGWAALALALVIALSPGAVADSDGVDAIDLAKKSGDFDRAERLARERVAQMGPASAPQAAADARRALAQVLIDRTRYDEAEVELEEALALLEPLGTTESLGRTYKQIARVHRYRADYVTALDWLRRAEQVFEQLDHAEGRLDVYNLYGVVYDFLGQLERSLDWHRRALELAHQLGDTEGIANGLYAIGEAHRTLGEHAKALEFFEDALKLDTASGDVRNIAYSHNKVGMTHLELGRLDLARFHLTRARDLFAGSDSWRDTRWAESNLGRLAAAEGRLDEARALLESILADARRERWPVLIDASRVALAEVELEAGHFDLALAYLDPALSDALAKESLRAALRIYKLRMRVLEAAGRPEEALASFRSGYELERQLFDSLRASALAALQGEAEFERQSIALQLAEQEREITSLALERERTVRLAGMLTLLAVFVFAFLAYGRWVTHRQNRRLSSEVDAKTKDLRERNTELEHAYQAVERASITDPLTGLANRRYLDRQISGDVARAIRNHETSPAGELPNDGDLVFFMVDIDHFKAINDREGHVAGDEVLVEFAQLLERHFRKSDLLVRWGGEEFLVLARFTNRCRAAEVAERLRESVEAHTFLASSGRALHVTCSIGFAAFPLRPECPTAVSWCEVVELADQALYAVKQGPRNGWAGFYAPRPVTPTRPFSDWIPVALDSGELCAVSSFEAPTTDWELPRESEREEHEFSVPS